MFYTPRQLKIVGFIRGYIQDHGISPTLDEIAAHFGVTKITIFEHLRALETKGAIRRRRHFSRSIELVDDPRHSPNDTLEMPIKGTLTQGRPIEFFPEQQSFNVAEFLTKEPSCHLIEVRGEALPGEAIRPGDLLIVDPRREPSDGEVVLASIDGGPTTLVRIFYEANRVRLEPPDASQSSQRPPSYPTEVKVEAVVRGLIRRYRD